MSLPRHETHQDRQQAAGTASATASSSSRNAAATSPSESGIRKRRDNSNNGTTTTRRTTKRPSGMRGGTGATPVALRTWPCPRCGGETDVRESMGRCSHCGGVQWNSYLLLPALGAGLLVVTAVVVLALGEAMPVVASVVKWSGLALGTFLSWLGWYILVLDLTKDRIVLVWLITIALGSLAGLLARLL